MGIKKRQFSTDGGEAVGLVVGKQAGSAFLVTQEEGASVEQWSRIAPKTEKERMVCEIVI